MTTSGISEVRVTLREDGYSRAYFLSQNDNRLSGREWTLAQIHSHVISDIVKGEDFTWVQDLLDEYLVPSPHAVIAWAAARGTYEPVQGEAFAVCISADIYPGPGEDHFYRIATFPMGPWAGRERGVELGIRAMAVQRYVREVHVHQLAQEYSAREDRRYVPMTIPGLRLRYPIPPMSREEWGDEPGYDDPKAVSERERSAQEDYCSAVGGING